MIHIGRLRLSNQRTSYTPPTRTSTGSHNSGVGNHIFRTLHRRSRNSKLGTMLYFQSGTATDHTSRGLQKLVTGGLTYWPISIYIHLFIFKLINNSTKHVTTCYTPRQPWGIMSVFTCYPPVTFTHFYPVFRKQLMVLVRPS